MGNVFLVVRLFDIRRPYSAHTDYGHGNSWLRKSATLTDIVVNIHAKRSFACPIITQYGTFLTTCLNYNMRTSCRTRNLEG